MRLQKKSKKYKRIKQKRASDKTGNGTDGSLIVAAVVVVVAAAVIAAAVERRPTAMMTVTLKFKTSSYFAENKRTALQTVE